MVINELPIKIDQPVVKELKGWAAHAGSVRSVKAYSSPECLVTAGNDHMVKIWSMDWSRGDDDQLISCLRAYSRPGSKPWSFPAQSSAAAIDDERLRDVLDRVKREESRNAKNAQLQWMRRREQIEIRQTSKASHVPALHWSQQLGAVT